MHANVDFTNLKGWLKFGAHVNSKVKLPKAIIVLGSVTLLTVEFPMHPTTMAHLIIVGNLGEPYIFNWLCENQEACS